MIHIRNEPVILLYDRNEKILFARRYTRAINSHKTVYKFWIAFFQIKSILGNNVVIVNFFETVLYLETIKQRYEIQNYKNRWKV